MDTAIESVYGETFTYENIFHTRGNYNSSSSHQKIVVLVAISHDISKKYNIPNHLGLSWAEYRASTSEELDLPKFKEITNTAVKSKYKATGSVKRRRVDKVDGYPNGWREIYAKYEAKQISVKTASNMLGISENSFYRYQAKAKKERTITTPTVSPAINKEEEKKNMSTGTENNYKEREKTLTQNLSESIHKSYVDLRDLVNKAEIKSGYEVEAIKLIRNINTIVTDSGLNTNPSSKIMGYLGDKGIGTYDIDLIMFHLLADIRRCVYFNKNDLYMGFVNSFTTLVEDLVALNEITDGRFLFVYKGYGSEIVRSLSAKKRNIPSSSDKQQEAAEEESAQPA